jgi:diguanylate cyclase (GGDEF)-like protein
MKKTEKALDIRIFTPLFDLGETRDVKTGTILFREGEIGDCMYLIEQGKVCIMFDHDRERKGLGPGKIFGELAVLTKHNHRTGSAVATTDCRLKVIRRESIERFRREHSEAAYEILREACSYLLDSEISLINHLKVRNRQLESTLDYLRRTTEELDSKELMSLTDEMTGFYNRRCFNLQLPKYIEHAKETGQSYPGMALILIDIDKFKTINDTYGHPAGDEVLRHLAKLIMGKLGKTDLPCRLGGDEFVLILNNTSESAARSWTVKLLNEIFSTKVKIPSASLNITASMSGVMLKPDDNPSKLLTRADESLYLVKRKGRNGLDWMGELIHPNGT